MSADNISICPACLKKARNDYEQIQKDLKSEYGKISQAEYEELQSRAAKKVEAEAYRTLVEYEGFSINESFVFTARYSCKCHTCGFEHDFLVTDTIEAGIIT
jgi:hypothetical protein